MSSLLQCHVVPGGLVDFSVMFCQVVQSTSCPLQCHVVPGGPFHCSVTWSPVVHSMSRGARWSIPCHVEPGGPFHFSVTLCPVVHSTSVSGGARWSNPLQCHVEPGGPFHFSVMLDQVVLACGPVTSYISQSVPLALNSVLERQGSSMMLSVKSVFQLFYGS